jgi:uncharacterized protein YbaR (Trm112 family)
VRAAPLISFGLKQPNACLSPNFFYAREEPRELAITPDFIETFKVVCPACKGRVVLKDDASGIKCTECRRVYPVRNDIPALIVEEATVEDEEPREKS